MRYSFRSFAYIAGAVASLMFTVTISYADSTSTTTRDDPGWWGTPSVSSYHYVDSLAFTTFHDVALIAEKAPAAIDHGEDLSPADIAYESARQPGQAWRIAAACYRHIDPGRRLMI